MKNVGKLVVIGALLALGAARSNAQTSVTNVIQDLKFKLTGYYQLAPTEGSDNIFRHMKKVTINNKDILNLLELQLGVIFNDSAKLLLVSKAPVDRTPKVMVRQSIQGEKVYTDVTEFFSAQLLAGVEDTKIHKEPLRVNGLSYDVLAFQMTTLQASFQLQGFGKMKVKTLNYKGEPAAAVHLGKLNSVGAGEYAASPDGTFYSLALDGMLEVKDDDIQVETGFWLP